VTDELNLKIKSALLLAARRQAELEYALEDLEDVLTEGAPNEPFPGDVFTQNAEIDKALMDLAEKHKVDIPDPQPRRT
jgi:hypothetical protein